MFTINPGAPLDERVLKKAQALYRALPSLIGGRRLNRGYGHWSAWTYGVEFPNEYNVMATFANGEWNLNLLHDPNDNARQLEPGDSYAAHTYHRNSFAFGICIGAMHRAEPHDFGDAPVTLDGAEHFIAGAAAVCRRYGIPTNVQLGEGEHTFMTHGEAAIQDSYFPGDGDPDARWDWALTQPGPLSKAICQRNGTLIRARMHRYALRLP